MAEPSADRPRGLFERIMFSFMGPPELGEDRAPEGYAPDPAAALCRTCHRPYDDHERVHSGSATYLRCPSPDEGDAG